MVEEVMVVEAKVLRPVKLFVPERVARFERSDRLPEERPVIVAPVKFTLPLA